MLCRHLNYKPINLRQPSMIRPIEISWKRNFRVGWSCFVSSGDRSALDTNESTNYRNTLVLMLFDRWQHCRQMDETARHLVNLAALPENANDMFIDEMYTLIRNTGHLATLIQETTQTMVLPMRRTLIWWLQPSFIAGDRYFYDWSKRWIDQSFRTSLSIVKGKSLWNMIDRNSLTLISNRTVSTMFKFQSFQISFAVPVQNHLALPPLWIFWINRSNRSNPSQLPM